MGNYQKYLVSSKRHKKALEYAISQMKQSELSKYIEDVYLFGSCVRGQEKWDSDVDLLVQMQPCVAEDNNLRKHMRLLKSKVTMTDVYAPEADIKIVMSNEWKTSPMIFYENVRREGVSVWHW